MKNDNSDGWGTVLRTIEKDLLSGKLKPGDRLPPERAFAAELVVGRAAVREALRVLEVLGLVGTQTAAEQRSGAIIVASPSGGMDSLIRLQVAAQGFQIADVVRTRLLLETSVVKELAERGETAELSEVTRILDEMDDPNLSQKDFTALDAQFHLALAQASDNQVMTAIMAGLRTSIQKYALEGAMNLPEWPSTANRLRGEHRAIAMAVMAGDGQLAAAHVHKHLTDYYVRTHFTSTPPHKEDGGS